MATEHARTEAIPKQQAAADVADHGESWPAVEQWFQYGFDHMPCGMVVTSLTPGRPNLYLAANDSFCRLAGFTWAELAGREFLGDFHPDEQPVLDAAIQRVISGDGQAIRTSSHLIREDGQTVSVRLTCAAIQQPSGERYLSAFVEDVTAAEQAAAEMSQLRHELARARRMESLGHLLDGIAHDFNNLLTVIGSYTSLAHEEVSMAEATDSAIRWRPVRSDLEQVQDAAERARMLIKHMLAFARRESAKVEDVDLAHLVSDASLLLGELLGENIPFAVRPARGAWPVRASPAMLEQVITDIAANARDAMPAGGQVTIGIENARHLGLARHDAPGDQPA